MLSPTTTRRLVAILPWAFFATLGFGTYAYAQTVDRVPVLPDLAFDYTNPTLPAHFTTGPVADADNTPAGNPVSNEGATLGRVLFYDRLLSANNTTSCSACHAQSSGFTDSNALSVGFEGQLTGRHSMSLANARYYESGRFFWDERAATLEDQVLMPIQDLVEMGMTLDDLETKLAATNYYPDLFTAAFGTPEVTSDRISQALAQFVRSMVSSDSKYDEGVVSGFRNFTAVERLGRQLFNQNSCNRCHGTDAQIGTRGATNNGLDAVTTDDGAGRGQFKVPSLRNVALGAPYMHDGRFATLEEVVEHYDSGVQANVNLDPALREGPPGPGTPIVPTRLNFTQAEKDALVAFLNTLTDPTFVSAERFSDPFVDSIVEPPSTPTCDSKPVTIDLNTNGGVGYGTSGPDVILGTDAVDYIYGFGGDDIICGGAGIDRIFGGDGNDLIFGEGGSDRIYGEAGADVIWAGSGADRVSGGTGDDTLFGQGGQDFMWGDDGNDTMQGNFQTDNMWGGSGDDQLAGAAGKDKLYGEAGNDQLFGGDNTDYLDGGDGMDVANGQRGGDNPLLADVSGCVAETKISC